MCHSQGDARDIRQIVFIAAAVLAVAADAVAIDTAAASLLVTQLMMFI